jgi:hypothetical protein
LAVEVVLVGIPVDSSSGIRVRVDDGDALEIGGGFEDRKRDSIADHLSIIILDDRRADDVSAGRKVDESRLDSCRIAPLTATTARGDGGIDGSSVVGHAVSFGPKVHDVAEDLVVGGAESDCALALDISHPVGRSSFLDAGVCCDGGKGVVSGDCERSCVDDRRLADQRGEESRCDEEECGTHFE